MSETKRRKLTIKGKKETKIIKYKPNNDVIEKFKAVNIRFPTDKFCVSSLFESVEDIENKILTNEYDTIIVMDKYSVCSPDPNYKNKGQFYGWIEKDVFEDYFIVKKREDADAIYYKDVIDELIKQNFDRKEVDYLFLEGISKINRTRNKNSIPVFGLGWGS